MEHVSLSQTITLVSVTDMQVYITAYNDYSRGRFEQIRICKW